MLGLIQQEHGTYLLVVETEEPTSVQEAQGHEFWRKVMLDEMTTIEANGTWELAEAPTVQHLIVLKWVFKTKKNAADIVTKHKVRLIAKGYIQQQGVDFDEVFASVAWLESVQLLLAYVVGQGWPIHHMDVKSMFLIGELLGGSLCHAATWFHHCRCRRQGVAARKGALWAAFFPSHMVCQAGCVTCGARLSPQVYVYDLVITGGDITKLKQFREEM
jgi:hypothetical protein